MLDGGPSLASIALAPGLLDFGEREVLQAVLTEPFTKAVRPIQKAKGSGGDIGES
jgi:hypothetical protein